MKLSHLIFAGALLGALPPAVRAGDNTPPPAPSDKAASVKPDTAADKKTKPVKTKDADTKSASQTTQKPESKAVAPKGFATEGDAQTRCGRAAVVWRDGDGINHYPGSREYGRKPGSFACEQ